MLRWIISRRNIIIRKALCKKIRYARSFCVLLILLLLV